jgi:hypothetical protein
MRLTVMLTLNISTLLDTIADTHSAARITIKLFNNAVSFTEVYSIEFDCKISVNKCVEVMVLTCCKFEHGIYMGLKKTVKFNRQDSRFSGPY